MGFGTSIFLVAVGAILDFAIDVQTTGVDLHAIGVILMIVGGIGLFLSFLFWNSWGGFGSSRRTTVVEGDLPAGRHVVQRDEIVR
jgi:hypothetical protein